MIVSKAPYHKDHLLVIPKRHLLSFLRLKEKECRDLDELNKTGIRLLHKKGHKGITLLIRNGKSSGKSINHLHYHIIPDIQISALRKDMNNREIISNKKEFKKVKTFRNILKTLKK